MSTRTTVLTPEQEAFLATPHEALTDVRSDTPYSARLRKLGLIAKAERAKDDGHYWEWYRSGDGIPWRVPCSNSMLRTTPHYALELAKEQYIKYQRFEELVHSIFSTVTLYLHFHKFSEGRDLIEQVRKAVDRVLPGTLDKIGYVRGGWVVKLIFRSNIDREKLTQLQAELPPGVTASHKNHLKAEFKGVLKDLVSPDLPSTEEGRADFEYLLEDIHQITARKLSREDRTKFVYDPSHSYTNLDDSEVVVAANEGKPCPHCGKIHSVRVPKDPRTKKLATHRYGEVVTDAFRITDLQPTYWIELPKCPDQ